jgi:hypothetical protein
MSNRDRKRGDSLSSAGSEGSPKTKGRGERLIASGRPHSTVGTTFLSGDHGISPGLVSTVSNRACQFTMTFSDEGDDHSVYYGQGGLIRGDKIAETPVRGATAGGNSNSRKRRRVSFSQFASYAAIPVTAKHNLELAQGDRAYLRTIIKFVDGPDKDVSMPDGGCTMTGEVEIRVGTNDTAPLFWDAGEVSFGDEISRPQSSLTKKPRLYVKAPNTFRLAVGHKIGIAVYRTFDITHEDAGAPISVRLEDVYGPKHQVCIYTGEVTEVSEQSETFCHSINTFEGCSGAVIFLLDQDQEDAPEEVADGMAVGIHVGGLDTTNNLGFMLK